MSALARFDSLAMVKRYKMSSLVTIGRQVYTAKALFWIIPHQGGSVENGCQAYS
jgi:hypothetical protein